MMRKHCKRELTKYTFTRHLKVGKAEKKKILNEFTGATGYNCKHAIKLEKHGLKRKGYKKVGRKKKYQSSVVGILENIWETCRKIYPKQLHPFIPEMLSVVKRE